MVAPWAARASGRRVLEWSLLLLVIVLVAGWYVQAFRVVQAQGEAAAVKTTLGALRTALLIDYLKGVAEGAPAARPVSANPFLLLDRVPPNYAGQHGQSGQPQTAGTWVFDAQCRCIGYEPLYPQGLNTPADAPGLWFRISAKPPLQIQALQAYRWLDETLD